MHSVASSVLPVGCTVSRHLCYQLAAQSHVNCQEPLDLKRALFSGDPRVKGQQPRTHTKRGMGGWVGEGVLRSGGGGEAMGYGRHYKDCI